MTSENEVSLLMRVSKLTCSSSSCENAFKSFLYLRIQMAIDIFGINKTDNLRILPLFNLYTNAKLPYWSILSYHNKCTVVITNMGRFVYPFWKKRMIAIWSSAVDSVFFLWLFFGIFFLSQPILLPFVLSKLIVEGTFVSHCPVRLKLDRWFALRFIFFFPQWFLIDFGLT